MNQDNKMDWWKMYEDRKCYNEKECKYNDMKRCAISAYSRCYEGVSSTLNVQNYKSEISSFMKDFSDNLKKEAQNCYENQRISKGNRKIVPNAFTKSFIKMLKEIIPTAKTETEINIISNKYKEAIGKKIIDIRMTKTGTGAVFIEFKTVISNNDIGAVLFEAMVIDKKDEDKFYIVTLQSPGNFQRIKEMIKKEPFSKYINDIFFLDSGADMKELCDLLKEIDNHFSGK